MGLFDYNRPGIQKILNDKLLVWPGPGKEKWTVGDSFRGVLVMGATGSGKSSASGKLIAESFLEYGYGGLVLCAKKDELGTWLKYGKKHGRLDDFVIIQNGSEHQFNPLEYEQNREGDGAGDVQNLLEILMTLHAMGKNFSAGGTGRGDERFWENAMRRLLVRVLQLLSLAKLTISFHNIFRIVNEMMDEEDADRYTTIRRTLVSDKVGVDEKKKAQADLDQIKEHSLCLEALIEASERRKNGLFSKDEEYEYQSVQSYFLREVPKMDERTYSIIKESALGIVFPFQLGLLKRHFSTTVSPSMMPELAYQEGKIFIMDISVKEYLLSGVYGQGVYKYLFQQAMERRKFNEGDFPRPIFIWADEAHNFITEHDSLFATTARSSFVSIVNLTQNLPNIHTAMGTHGHNKTMSLLGNMSTKIFHANSDPQTNNYASNMIGQIHKKKRSKSVTEGKISTSSSDHIEMQVLPGDFTTLKTGGFKHGLKAEGYVTQTGETYDEVNYMLATFKQK